MKLSIVISIYNSHGAVSRQTKYYRDMKLSDDVEFVFVDDGSKPAHSESDYDLKNLKFHYTNNNLAWTQGLGRNIGASKAVGEYLLMTDIDHMFSKEVIEESLNYRGFMMRFPRCFGVLDEVGCLKTDLASLKSYGLADKYLTSKDFRIQMHLNTFLIPRWLFTELGGYDPKHCTYGFHPKSKKGDDCYFNSLWKNYARKHNLTQDMGSGLVYVFPNGRFHKDGSKNPHGLFHDLHHEEVKFFKND